jgi:hypothetical protein
VSGTHRGDRRPGLLRGDGDGRTVPADQRGDPRVVGPGARQDAIEAELARRHLGEGAMAMFDLSSSWMEGTHCELAARGYSRDGKKGKTQIEYGLLTDAQARPVAVRVFPGNTADPTAFIEAVEVVRTNFGLNRLTMVGDRGMITSARIDAIKDTGLSWITCLRAPDIAALAADDGPLQMSLFDTHDLAEITHPDYPGERLIACRNPALADLRAHKRENLLAATEALLDKIVNRVHTGTLSGQDTIGLAIGKVIDKYKMAKHFTLHIAQTTFSYQRKQDRINAETALDGLYVIRTNVPATDLDPTGAVIAYKNLAGLERDWRNIKTGGGRAVMRPGRRSPCCSLCSCGTPDGCRPTPWSSSSRRSPAVSRPVTSICR